MAQANDSTRYCRIAQEPAYATAPPTTIAIAGGSGTLIVTIDGTSAASQAFDVALLTLQGVLNALAPVIAAGGSFAVTGTPGTSYVLTPTAGNAGALPISAVGAAGCTPTVTGGPVWMVALLDKAGHVPKLAVDLAKEMRNSPDPYYADGVAEGGQVEDWSFDGRIYAQQFGHWLRMGGFDDTKTTKETTAYYHTLIPGSGLSYTVQYYDGLKQWQSMGVRLTDLTAKGMAGPTGADTLTAKGWGWLARMLASVPTQAMPANVPGTNVYRMLSPKNAGRYISIASTVTSLVHEWQIQWKWPTTPFYTQTGTGDPYRPSFGDREVDMDSTLVFDDATEATQARTVPVPQRAWRMYLPGVETIGASSTPAVDWQMPLVTYQEPPVDSTAASPVLKVKGKGLKDTVTLSAALWCRITNETSSAY